MHLLNLLGLLALVSLDFSFLFQSRRACVGLWLSPRAIDGLKLRLCFVGRHHGLRLDLRLGQLSLQFADLL